MSSAGEKRKATSASASADADLQPATKKAASGKKNKPSSATASGTPTEIHVELDYEALTLPAIRSRIKDLCRSVPNVPASGQLDAIDSAAIKIWASKMQIAIEAFNLLICTVSAATYKWGSTIPEDSRTNEAMVFYYVASERSNIFREGRIERSTIISLRLSSASASFLAVNFVCLPTTSIARL